MWGYSVPSHPAELRKRLSVRASDHPAVDASVGVSQGKCPVSKKGLKEGLREVFCNLQSGGV